MTQELAIFQNHVQERGLRHSAKRDTIVQTFLDTRHHVSAQDLHSLVKKDNPQIGYTTVYRTLKLIVTSGLAEEVDFNDGMKRFERKVGREFHAHFICTSCGKNQEVFDKNIRDLSLALSRQSRFIPQNHRFEIFGLCGVCHRDDHKHESF